ncbi:hypothetical protein F7725_019736 [Dissostichus mawsoni]|uniref:Uncharacterized protein n=1 Tax=Dissostichus mawsoni TaxID=36200 RepID=A0A7J5YNJ7_DISMA|nr:hypothetical protein F7725_019736 [Dissostichus mawsoni]
MYMSSSQDPWSNAIQDWYDEVQNWRYGVGSTNGRVVVWYRSNKVGCGVAYYPNSQYKYFYVYQYCPPTLAPANQYPPVVTAPTPATTNSAPTPVPTDKYSNCPDLKQQETCSNADVASWFPASCKCTSQII